ncbi:hypothetical protein RCL1_003593 [Eukaryota sp. TZLM3-RCL]
MTVADDDFVGRILQLLLRGASPEDIQTFIQTSFPTDSPSRVSFFQQILKTLNCLQEYSMLELKNLLDSLFIVSLRLVPLILVRPSHVNILSQKIYLHILLSHVDPFVYVYTLLSWKVVCPSVILCHLSTFFTIEQVVNFCLPFIPRDSIFLHLNPTLTPIDRLSKVKHYFSNLNVTDWTQLTSHYESYWQPNDLIKCIDMFSLDKARRCHDCVFGAHSYLTSDNCPFNLKTIDPLSQSSFYKVLNFPTEQSISICPICSLHLVRHVYRITKHGRRRTDDDINGSCMKDMACRACMLFGHCVDECPVAIFSGSKLISLPSYRHSLLIFPVSVWIHSPAKHVESEDNKTSNLVLSNSLPIDDEYEDNIPPCSLEKEYESLASDAIVRMNTSPLFAVISRFMNLVRNDRVLLSFFNPNIVYSNCLDSFYNVRPITDNLWSTYPYIPSLFRYNFSFIYYSGHNMGPFYENYCKHETQSNYSLLKTLVNFFNYRFKWLHEFFHPSHSILEKDIVIQEESQ